MNKIRLLLPYYGQWPSYLQIFLRSLERNNIIEAALISDLPSPANIPSNCVLIPLSMDDLRLRIQRYISKDATLDSPYKLCDYKPAYAEIFPDLVDGYSYWAFGDLDLVYGNISKCLPPNWDEYDILTFRIEWISGAFTILANNFFVNSLYRQSLSFPQIFESIRYTGFDECFNNFSVLIGRQSDTILGVDRRQSFGYLVRLAQVNNHARVFQETRIKESLPPSDSLLVDSNGILDARGIPYILYHYITEKKSFFFTLPDWQDLPDKFYIDRFGFQAGKLTLVDALFRAFLCNLRGFARCALSRLMRFASKVETLF